MADSGNALANALLSALAPISYEEWSSKNAVRPDETQAQRTGRSFSEFAHQAPTALLGLSAPAATASMSAFNALAPKAPLPRAPQGVGQSVYEAVLGRPPGGAPGSGHTANGWAKSPLAYLLAGGAGYGWWNGMGGPETWEQLKSGGFGDLYRDLTSGEFADRAKYRGIALENNLPLKPDPNRP